MSSPSIYTAPPPRWTDVTEDQIHGLAAFLRAGSEGVSGSDVRWVCDWIGVVSSFVSCCLSVAQRERDAVLDSLEYAAACSELAFAKKAALQLARFEARQSRLVATAIAWMTTPHSSMAVRPWRYPYFDGVCVSKDRADVENDLAANICVAGARVADTLLESGALAEPEKTRLLEGIRGCAIPWDSMWLLR